MAAFYLDEDIPVILADLLRVQGHIATTTRDEGRMGNPDPAQLLFAADRAMTFVTHNRTDFACLHEAWLTWARGWDNGTIPRRNYRAGTGTPEATGGIRRAPQRLAERA